jgi:hypothetical protein
MQEENIDDEDEKKKVITQVPVLNLNLHINHSLTSQKDNMKQE